MTVDGGATAFCAIDCSNDEPCPETTRCEDIVDGVGTPVARQCLPVHVVEELENCAPEDLGICPPLCAECDANEDCSAAPTCR